VRAPQWRRRTARACRRSRSRVSSSAFCCDATAASASAASRAAASFLTCSSSNCSARARLSAAALSAPSHAAVAGGACAGMLGCRTSSLPRDCVPYWLNASVPLLGGPLSCCSCSCTRSRPISCSAADRRARNSALPSDATAAMRSALLDKEQANTTDNAVAGCPTLLPRAKTSPINPRAKVASRWLPAHAGAAAAGQRPAPWPRGRPSCSVGVAGECGLVVPVRRKEVHVHLIAM
jgi:hypothetical protein